ncbi:hypothetical protein [Embleya sp. NPDC020886]|uniref:hypothetical protein n=1 Tax=Embleya sp. NPDC020886 TaxID=3363980 RepID=UPI0037972B7C
MDPHALLLDQAPAHLLGDILDRLPAGTRAAVFGEWRLPGDAVLRHVVDRGDGADRAMLAANRAIGPDLLLRLATDADPRVATAVFGNADASREAKLAALPRVPVGEHLRAKPVRRPLRAGWDLQLRVYPLVESDDPALVAAALARLEFAYNRHGAPAVLLRGCLSLLRTAGPAAAAAARAAVPPFPDDPQLPEVVRRALAEPTDAALLTHALDHETSASAVVARLCVKSGSGDPTLALSAPRGALDWARITVAVRAMDRDAQVRTTLAHQPGCPDELLPRVPRFRRPLGSLVRPAHARRALFAQMATGAHFEREVGIAFATGLLRAAPILDRVTPAYRALEVFRDTPDTRMADLRTALGARSRLGDRVEAWAVALALLAEFTGTVPELLDVAGAVTA